MLAVSSAPSNEQKTFTPEEIAKHAREGDAWVVISGKVYDLSHFKHSGGFKALSAYVGKDGTNRFNRIHTARHLAILDTNFLIGKVADTIIARDTA